MKRAIIVIILMAGLALGLVGAATAAEGYTHPSGAFIMTPYGELVDEVPNGAIFEDEIGGVMVFFGQAKIQLDEETLPLVVLPMLDGLSRWRRTRWIWKIWLRWVTGYFIHFDYAMAEDVTGVGDVFVARMRNAVHDGLFDQ
jgi:hypothetical protein